MKRSSSHNESLPLLRKGVANTLAAPNNNAMRINAPPLQPTSLPPRPPSSSSSSSSSPVTTITIAPAPSEPSKSTSDSITGNDNSDATTASNPSDNGNGNPNGNTTTVNGMTKSQSWTRLYRTYINPRQLHPAVLVVLLPLLITCIAANRVSYRWALIPMADYTYILTLTNIIMLAPVVWIIDMLFNASDAPARSSSLSLSSSRVNMSSASASSLPLLYRYRGTITDEPSPPVPYRVVIAVATLDTIAMLLQASSGSHINGPLMMFLTHASIPILSILHVWFPPAPSSIVTAAYNNHNNTHISGGTSTVNGNTNTNGNGNNASTSVGMRPLLSSHPRYTMAQSIGAISMAISIAIAIMASYADASDISAIQPLIIFMCSSPLLSWSILIKGRSSSSAKVEYNETHSFCYYPCHCVIGLYE
jgi:hypothetical protein